VGAGFRRSRLGSATHLPVKECYQHYKERSSKLQRSWKLQECRNPEGNGSSEVERLLRVGKTRSGETQRATPPVSARGATTTCRRSRTTAHGGFCESDRSSGKLQGAGAPGAGSSKPKPRGQRLRKAGSLTHLVLASRVCKTRVTESKPRGQRFTVRNAGQRKDATSKGHQQTRPKP